MKASSAYDKVDYDFRKELYKIFKKGKMPVIRCASCQGWLRICLYEYEKCFIKCPGCGSHDTTLSGEEFYD